MASVMSKKPLRNKVHRSGFDLSNRNCFTAKVGEILPVSVDEVLPGDHWKINIREFMRTAPVQTATFGRMRQYYDFYFVPYRLLWNGWDEFISKTGNSYSASDYLNSSYVGSSLPFFCASDIMKILTNYASDLTNVLDNGYSRFHGSIKLLQYLGYPYYYSVDSSGSIGIYSRTILNSTDLALNPFPVLAYQKIYQDYFRNKDWEDAAPWTYNINYMSGSVYGVSSEPRIPIATPVVNGDVITGSKYMFDLQSCNYDKDLFNGLLPSPQFGETAIAGPLSGYLSSSDAVLSAGYEEQDSHGVTTEPGSLSFTLDSSTTAGISALLLRQAEALQKWKEITLSGSPDYVDQIKKHWNVNLPHELSNLCTYLGGISNNIDISEVINTNLAESSYEANVAGKGVSASNGFIEFDSKEYGLLMCVYHCKPIVEWQANYMLPKLLTKTDVDSFAIPEFDQLGNEAVQAYQFFMLDSDPSSIVGYAPRYYEYKCNIDTVHGEFLNTLTPWVIPHYLSSDDVGTTDFNYIYFKVSINAVDNIFGTVADSTTATDHFYNSVYFDKKVVRNLSRDGLPY